MVKETGVRSVCFYLQAYIIKGEQEETGQLENPLCNDILKICFLLTQVQNLTGSIH